MAEQPEATVAEVQIQDTETTQTEEENNPLNSDHDDGAAVTEPTDQNNDAVDANNPQVSDDANVDQTVETEAVDADNTEAVSTDDTETVDNTELEDTVDQPANPEADVQEGEDETEQPVEPFTKIVFLIRQGMSTIGIQQNGTDPEFQSVSSGELEDVLAATPEAFSKAIQKWNKTPKRKDAKPVQRIVKATAPAKTKKTKDDSSNLKLF